MSMNLPYIDVAVGILVNKEGEILLAERPSGKSFAGWWEFPGGKIEQLETPLDALARELEEELGIKIKHNSTVLLGNIEYAYPEFFFKAPVFTCTAWENDPQPLEGQKLAWVEPRSLVSYQLLPACKEILLLLSHEVGER
jgi:8-oxo-dGTP diphosphatase